MDSLRGPMQKFAIALFQAYRREQPDGNLLYSPMTASTGLLLILIGSSGKTKAEIEAAMKFGDSPLFSSATFEHDLKMAYRYTMAVISKSRKTEEDGRNGGGFRVYRAMKLFVDRSIPLRPQFVENIIKLKAEAEGIDFSTDCEAARQEINAYVDLKMNGKCSECFKEDAIAADSKMVLVNGICFRARWDVTFDPERTTTQLFNLLDGKTVEVPMMNGVFRLAFAQDPEIGVTYLEIPYAMNAASLLIFLPMKSGGLREMSRNLSPTVVNRINLVKRLKDVNISLPRFVLNSQLDMKTLFSKIGVKSLLNDAADFSRMTDDKAPISLSAAVHNGHFSVNERGTDADDSSDGGPYGLHINNSATSFINDKRLKRSISTETAKTGHMVVNVNHPFLFSVRHNRSGIMMWLGRVESLP